MNYETINYAYLSGILESEIYTLAYDEKFLKMRDCDARRDYAKKVVENARQKTLDFEKRMKGA
jgi:hypothetical protein